MLLTQLKTSPENLTVFSLEPSPGSCTMAGHPGPGEGSLKSHGETLGEGASSWHAPCTTDLPNVPRSFLCHCSHGNNLAARSGTVGSTSDMGRWERGAEWSFRDSWYSSHPRAGSGPLGMGPPFLMVQPLLKKKNKGWAAAELAHHMARLTGSCSNDHSVALARE